MENWEEVRNCELVKRALRGALKWRGHQIHRVDPLLPQHLDLIFKLSISSTSTYDDLLFTALSVAGFFALHRLGEIVVPDNNKYFDARKIIKRSSTSISPTEFQYHLPYHKADPLFKGTLVVILATSTTSTFSSNKLLFTYLRCRDQLHGLEGPLFLRQNGTSPTRSWYLKRLNAIVGEGVAGHSLRPGGATWYALRGAKSDIIRRLGRWSPNSTTWEQYIRAHASLFIALH